MSGTARKILMVDDDPGFREMMREALLDRWQDLDIDEARDGYIAEKRLAGGDYDLILLDYRLPFGMSGLRFLERTRDMRGGIPLVMITGEGNEEVAARAFKLGATDYLVKRPGLTSTLVRLVDDIFGQDGAGDRKSASLVSAESGIELIRSYQTEMSRDIADAGQEDTAGLARAGDENAGQTSDRDTPAPPQSGIKAVEFGDREEIARENTEGAMEDAVLVEFEDPDEFNRFSGFIKRMDGVRLQEVRVLDGKFVVLLSLLPGRFARMGKVLSAG